MSNKILLLCLGTISLLTITSLTYVTLLTISIINKPNDIHYTVNITNNTTTHNTTNEIHNELPKQKTTTVTTKKTAPIKTTTNTELTKKTNGHSKEDITLLAKIINAEAKGEPFNGKVAVGNVILNRVKSKQFPDTIKGVIYQNNQFQPVSNGAINDKPSDESIKAANRALETNLVGDALYFYNPNTATDSWIRTRSVTNTIGNHAFAQ